jgi:hypothetical protein
MQEYAIGSRVILKDLSKTEYNGLSGIIKSKLNSNQRQQVSLTIDNETKLLGLKPLNLTLEPRSLDSLTTKEMKMVLSRVDYQGSLAGYDKSELRSLVEAHVATCSPDEIASILAKQVDNDDDDEHNREGGASSSNKTGKKLRQQMKNQADQLNNLSPTQLRQQAQMMRTMDPNMIRRMNPAMKHFTDAQIQMAAVQMDQMANNPQMVKGMVNQMNNMDDAQLENLQKAQEQHNGVAGAGAGGMTAPTPGVGGSAQGMQSMANMSPDQLRQQATMMKSMPKDTLRSMNPLMAKWSDAQIEMAIRQMETMAENPDISKRMMDQMKDMDPQELEKLRNMAQNGTMENSVGAVGTDTGTGTGAGGMDPNALMSQDPMQMMQNTNPAQIKQMLSMVKENPSLFKDMIRASNPSMADKLTDEQITKTMESFANLDESKIGWLMSLFGFVQKARTFLKEKGLYVLVVMLLTMMGFLYGFVQYRTGSKSAVVNVVNEGIALHETESSMPDVQMMIEEDEF